MQTWMLSGKLEEYKGTKTIERKPTKAESEEDVSEEDRKLHERIAAEVKSQLEAKGRSTEGVETFEAFYGLLQSEAVMLQKKYQPQLRDGIKIAVDLVNSVKEDAKDGDVDVRIKIAPNAEIVDTNIIPPSNEFELANGGLENDGHIILTANGKQKEIHLLSTHVHTTETDLINELEKWKERFTETRDSKIATAQSFIEGQQKRIIEATKSGAPSTQQKKDEQHAFISKKKGLIKEKEDYIKSLQNINTNDKTQVMAYLNKWSKSIGKMPTDKKTKFTDQGLMERVILATIEHNKDVINRNFTESDGTAKARGTTTGIRKTFSDNNLGVGYKFDNSMNIVQIDSLLSTVECRLIISDPFKFMVETAYLEP